MRPNKLLTVIFTYTLVALGLAMLLMTLAEVEGVEWLGFVSIFVFLMLIISNWGRFMQKLNRRVMEKRRQRGEI